MNSGNPAAEIIRVITKFTCPFCDSRRTREVGRGGTDHTGKGARPFSLDLPTVVCFCEWCGNYFVAWAMKFR